MANPECLQIASNLGLSVQARVGHMAARLRQRLEPYVAGDLAGFERAHAKEAERLAEAACGEAMLHTIGCATDTPERQTIPCEEQGCFTGRGGSLLAVQGRGACQN